MRIMKLYSLKVMFYSYFYLQNITDNFNPASKQMIATGKAYLKSLHGKLKQQKYYLSFAASSYNVLFTFLSYKSM